MQKVHVRRSLRAAACAAILAALGTGCSEIQEPVADALDPLAAVGEFGKPHSVPTRGRIVFSAMLTGDREIYSVLEDGTGLVRLTYNPGLDLWPTWSPDGRKIAFVSVRDANRQIYSMNADGSGVKRLTSFPFGVRIEHLRWSPDGRRIAYALAEPGEDDADLYTMSSNGKSIVRLTNRPGADEHPTWSPDASMLLFESSGDIHRVNADGTDEVVIMECTVKCYQPAWSPDGTQFSYGAEGRLYVHRFGIGTNQLHDGATTPVFSPDGVRVAYLDTATGSVFTVDALGGTSSRVTMFSLHTGQLDWGR